MVFTTLNFYLEPGPFKRNPGSLQNTIHREEIIVELLNVFYGDFNHSFNLLFFLDSIFLSNFELSGSKCLLGKTKLVPISEVSSYPGFKVSGLHCLENSTTKPRGMEIWFEVAGVRVIRGSSYRVILYYCSNCPSHNLSVTI